MSPRALEDESEALVPAIETWLIIRGAPPTTPSDLTTLLGIRPFKVIDIGRNRGRLIGGSSTAAALWSWQYRIGPSKSYDHPAQVLEMLTVVEIPWVAAAGALQERGVEGRMVLRADIYDSLPNWLFSASLLQRIASLGIDLEFDPVFCGVS